jgi:hypothetical protein
VFDIVAVEGLAGLTSHSPICGGQWACLISLAQLNLFDTFFCLIWLLEPG